MPSPRTPEATRIARVTVFETGEITEPDHEFAGDLTVWDIARGVVRALLMPTTKPPRFVNDDSDVEPQRPQIALDLTADEARRLAEALVVGAARSDLLTDDEDIEAAVEVAWMFADTRAAARSDGPIR